MTVKLLQGDLDALLNWSRTWKMSFNPSQCIHLIISNKHFSMPTSYKLAEYTIQQSQSATFPHRSHNRPKTCNGLSI